MKSLMAACVLVTGLVLASTSMAKDFYVAPNGDDSGPGTSAQPFATPTKAKDTVRTLIAKGLKHNVRVVFRAGTYELTAPLQFSGVDSGSQQYSITYSAAADEQVVLSGGRRIANWKSVGASKWEAELPEVKSGRSFFRQLIVNDRRAVRARWPNDGEMLHIETVDGDVKSFTFDRPLPKENFGGQHAELVVLQNWSISRAMISSSDERRLVTATPVGFIGDGDNTTASPGKSAFIENARAVLDQPGEWLLDRTTGVLTYLAAEGEQPDRTEVVAPVLTQLVKLTGTKDHPVRNVRFQGIRFEHTDFPLPELGYAEIQAAHYGSDNKSPTHVQPVAIECSYAEQIRFERCRFAHLNSSGIGFGPACRNNAVIGCVIEDIGGAGVMVGWRGTGKLVHGAEGTLDADWADPADVPTGNEISNCVIRRCGADSYGAPGIFVAFSTDTRLVHNHIYELPYTGISVGFRWNSTPTSQARCVVEYNHIHDVMQKLADGGGIYTLGLQPGTTFRGNHIHDVHRSPFAFGGAPNDGFFLDEGSQGFLFEANVVHQTSGSAVRYNQSRSEWHTWKDNSFDDDATPAVIEAASKRVGLESAFADVGNE